jgi:hypothetical protein
MMQQVFSFATAEIIAEVGNSDRSPSHTYFPPVCRKARQTSLKLLVHFARRVLITIILRLDTSISIEILATIDGSAVTTLIEFFPERKIQVTQA